MCVCTEAPPSPVHQRTPVSSVHLSPLSLLKGILRARMERLPSSHTHKQSTPCAWSHMAIGSALMSTCSIESRVVIHVCMTTYTHTHPCVLSYMQMQPNSLFKMPPHVPMYNYTIHAHIHTHKYTHSHTHTHKHTHAHTPWLLSQPCPHL